MLPGEFHLGLGGVHVDIHRRHRQRHLQHASGEPALHQLVPVALFQGGSQQLRLDEPAVDEKHLHGPGSPAVDRGRHEAPDPDVAAPAVHRHQGLGKLPAQGGVDSGFQFPIAGGVEGLLAVLDEFKGNVRVAQGQMLHKPCHGGRLRAVLFHEFQPGGGVVEQVRHPDGGALRGALLPDGAHVSPLAVDSRAHRVFRTPGQHIHPADGGNGCQSLAPEAQGADPGQVLRRPELAGGVAEKGGGQLARSNAAAVVRHPDEAHAAPLDLHHNGGSPGVDGIFHQLLHNGGRPLHHLACGDEVGYMG